MSCTLARECQSQQSTERSVGKTVSAHLTDSWGEAPVHGSDYKWHSLATTVHAWPAECMHVLLQVDSSVAFFVQKSVMLQFC